MKERKQLLDSLKPAEEIDIEAAREFIRTGNLKSDSKPPVPVAAQTEPDTQPDAKRESRSTRVRKPAAKRSETGTRSLRMPLTPVTLRMDFEMANALKRLSLERQLENHPLATQKDIITEALRPILQREGVL